jgi:hypothetical protein
MLAVTRRNFLTGMGLVLSTFGCGSSDSDLDCGSGTERQGNHCVAINNAGTAGSSGTGAVVCANGTKLIGNVCVANGNNAGASSGAYGGPMVAGAAGSNSTGLVPSVVAGASALDTSANLGGNVARSNSGPPNTSAAGDGGNAATAIAHSVGGIGGTTIGSTSASGGASGATRVDSFAAGAVGIAMGGTPAGGGYFGVGGAGPGSVSSVGGVSGNGATSGGGAGGFAGAGRPSEGGNSAVSGGVNFGGAPAAGNGGAGTPPAARVKWMALSFVEPLSLYDLDTFPNGTPLRVSDKTVSAVWAPNGRRILYSSGNGYAVRDVTDTGLSSPNLLGAIAPIGANIGGLERYDYVGPLEQSWAPDSRSLVISIGSDIGIIDTSVPLPTVARIASIPTRFEWAPTGARLLFSDDVGTYLANVSNGKVQSTSRLMSSPSNSWSWAPDGASLAFCSQGQLNYTRFGDAGPVTTQLTSPTVSTPSCDSVAFSPSGKKLVFAGSQTQPETGLYVFAVGSSGLSAPSLALAYNNIGSVTWSNTGDFVMVGGYGATDRYIIDLSGASPSSVTMVPGTSYVELLWASTAAQVLRRTSQSIDLFDCHHPSDGFVRLSRPSDTTIDQLAISPQSTMVAYLASGAVILVDTRFPQRSIVTLLGAYVSPTDLSWSRDSAFLAITSEDWLIPKYSYWDLLRVTGSEVSAPIRPWSEAQATPNVSWQPLIR